eukprot:scaffold1127_cov133-Skeletonema_marinoi.AAC.1
MAIETLRRGIKKEQKLVVCMRVQGSWVDACRALEITYREIHNLLAWYLPHRRKGRNAIKVKVSRMDERMRGRGDFLSPMVGAADGDSHWRNLS